MAVFLLMVSGKHLANRRGDNNTTVAKEMTAVRVSGNGLALINAAILVDPKPTVTAGPRCNTASMSCDSSLSSLAITASYFLLF